MSAAPTRPSPVVRFLSVLVGIFTRNLGAKIAALIMAVVVWFTVRQDITLEVTLPVQIRGLSASDLQPHGLMPVGTHETDVEVTFEGPRSDIDKIRKGDRARILLRVLPGNLGGEDRRSIDFSLRARNVEHPYAESVEIIRMEPETIRLLVAVKVRKKMPVHRPTFDGSLGEWKLEGDLVFTQEITVSGPKDVIDGLTDIATKPIPVGELLRGNGEENRRTLEGILDLANDLEKERVRAERGEVIEYTATFIRSRVPESIKVPFVVKYESLDSNVSLVIATNKTVERTDDGLQIELRFTGRKADLENIRKGVEEKSIRAFIRAEDFKEFVDGKIGEGGSFTGTVRLEMPDVLYRRVTVTQPERGDVFVTIDPR